MKRIEHYHNDLYRDSENLHSKYGDKIRDAGSFNHYYDKYFEQHPHLIKNAAWREGVRKSYQVNFAGKKPLQEGPRPVEKQRKQRTRKLTQEMFTFPARQQGRVIKAARTRDRESGRTKGQVHYRNAKGQFVRRM